MDGDTPVLLVGVRERGGWGRTGTQTHCWKGKVEWGLMVGSEKEGRGWMRHIGSAVDEEIVALLDGKETFEE